MDNDGPAAQPASRFLLLVTLPDGREEEHVLEGPEIAVGRDPSNHIQIPHHFVSQFHAKFVRSGDKMTVVDLGSANKTRVNGHAVLQKSLMEGDDIQFADVACRLVLLDSDRPSRRATSAPPMEPGSGRVDGVRDRDGHVGPRRVDGPVSRTYLSIVVIALFSVAAALALEVCR